MFVCTCNIFKIFELVLQKSDLIIYAYRAKRFDSISIYFHFSCKIWCLTWTISFGVILCIKLEDGQFKLQSRLEQEEEAKAALLGRIQRLTKLILVSTKASQSSRFSHRPGLRRRHSFGEEEVCSLLPKMLFTFLYLPIYFLWVFIYMWAVSLPAIQEARPNFRWWKRWLICFCREQ